MQAILRTWVGAFSFRLALGFSVMQYAKIKCISQFQTGIVVTNL